MQVWFKSTKKKHIGLFAFKSSSSSQRNTVNLVCINPGAEKTCCFTLQRGFCRDVEQSVLCRTLEFCGGISVYPCEFIWKYISDSVSVSLWPHSPLPTMMKAIFFSYPHSDSWCVLLTSNTSAQTNSIYRSPSWKRKTISVTLVAMNICATFCHVSLPMQLPLSLQNDSANAAVRALCRVHKIQLVLWKDMIVQMSSSPPRGIVMYTELVVGFNCDIYETWESNICAPDSFCGSATQRTLFPKGLNCCINYWWSGWINLSGIVFLSCKLVVPETVVGLNMRRLLLVF